MKKILVYSAIGLGLGLGSYATYLIVTKINNARIDSRTVSVEDALKQLEQSR